VNICAGGILCRENKILLGKRSAHRSFSPHVWDIIGGHAASNETPEQALGSPRNVLIDEHDALGWFEIYEVLQLDLALSGYAEVFKRLAEEIPARSNERKG
jgi:NUDIX domain